MDLEETGACSVASGTNMSADPMLDGVLDPRGVFGGYFDYDMPPQVNFLINWMRGTDHDDAQCHRCLVAVPRESRVPHVSPVPVDTKKHHVFGHTVIEKPAKPFAGERLRRLEFEDEVAEPVLVQEAYGICEGYRVLLELDRVELRQMIGMVEDVFGGPVSGSAIVAGGLYDKLLKARQALKAKLAGG